MEEGAANEDAAGRETVSEALVQLADRRVALLVPSLEPLVAALLRPCDLGALERPGDPAPAPGAPDSGDVVDGDARPRLREVELRVADDLGAGQRDEDALGIVVRPVHVDSDPVVERLHLALVARDVRIGLAGDLVDPAQELRAGGERDDVDAGGRGDRRRLDWTEVEREPGIPADLGEPSPTGPGEALGVVLGDVPLDRLEPRVADPAGEGGE